MSHARGILTRLAPIVSVAGLMAAASGDAWAQGFGPDPFRPYNNQFDPYVYPIGPGGPGAGGSAGANTPMRGQNQYQDYLNEISGAGRQRSERYGIGLPYYRSSVDPQYHRNRNRDYQPNRRTQESFEVAQQVIADKYLAAMSTKDPQKRKALFKDYERARQIQIRAMSARRASPSRILDRARKLENESQDGATPGVREKGAGGREKGASVREKAQRGLRAGAGNSDLPEALDDHNGAAIPPPPPISRGLPRHSPSASPRRSPSEVLKRARAMEAETASPGDPPASGNPRRDRDPIQP